MDQQYYSTTEVAQLLGISRVAVFKKIQKGEIPATKVGRNYIIAGTDLDIHQKKTLSAADKREIDHAVQKAVKEYGETIKLLGNA